MTTQTSSGSDILLTEVSALGPREAAQKISSSTPQLAVAVLAKLPPQARVGILEHLDERSRAAVFQIAPELETLWKLESSYPEGTIGRMMDTPLAVFSSGATVGDAVGVLRELVKKHLITYGFVNDEQGRLAGVFTMRDLLFNPPETPLTDVMLKNVFSLSAQTPVLDAMKETLGRHYPVYPVVDRGGILVGLIRGQDMFEAQAFELTAQAGSMVGVEKEERLATPWWKSFLFRHPWLQVNLFTAFLAAAVVGVFEETISQVVALAVFLPVLAGQSGNTGCQALAVALRAMTLGELTPGKTKLAVMKEGLLGFLNGVLVGITAGIGMFIFAKMQNNDNAGALAFVVFLAMVASCVISGVAGALIPVILKRCGADPATASSIFLTTATDVVSMGTFLGLATILVL